MFTSGNIRNSINQTADGNTTCIHSSDFVIQDLYYFFPLNSIGMSPITQI